MLTSTSQQQTVSSTRKRGNIFKVFSSKGICLNEYVSLIQKGPKEVKYRTTELCPGEGGLEREETARSAAHGAKTWLILPVQNFGGNRGLAGQALSAVCCSSDSGTVLPTMFKKSLRKMRGRGFRDLIGVRINQLAVNERNPAPFS